MPVKHWPTYLITGIPRGDREALSSEAATRDVSTADIVRSILCARFRLHCPPESSGYQATRDAGALTLLLRMQPKLARALDREAARTGRPKRRIILEAIGDHYEGRKE